MTMKKVICQCGKSINGNVLVSHITKGSCIASDEWRAKAYDMIERCREHPKAWNINVQPEERVCERHWWISVLNGETDLCEWEFSSPRKACEARKSSLDRISEERTGLGNPVCKAKSKNYDLFLLRSRMKVLWSQFLLDESLSFSDISKQFEEEFKDFSYQFAEVGIKDPHLRGHNKKNAVFAYLLEMDLSLLVCEIRKRRGVFISKGQKSSDKFHETASRLACELSSRVRVSNAHKNLYQLVLKWDENAHIEHRIKHNNTWKSFDIYSPKIHTLIEMHGRAWHSFGVDSLKDKVSKNIKNDLIKKNLAESLKYHLVVFWDDETEQWEDKLRRLYEEN